MKTNFKNELITKTIRLLAVICLMAFTIPQVKAQTDTEFWFVAPEINLSHYAPGGANAFLKLSTGNLPATVTISMPAGDPIVFPDIVVNIPAFGFQVVDLTCWVVSPCVGIDINTSYPEANYFDVNLLENKPLNASGINNFGILITSTTPVTAYYEISRRNNKDIWVLKGRNGLGTEFYTPFQTNRENWTGGNVKAYSAIDVVATEDGTVVEFSLPPGISASYGAPATTIPVGGTFTRTLNRGQTFSLFPRWRTDQTPQRPSQFAADRLRGVRIVSTNGSPIAVTVKDDSFYHTGGGCYDLAGDQLVSTDIIGKEYVVIRTDLYQYTSPSTNEHDHIYILATEDNTIITIFNPDGTIPATSEPGALANPRVINKGQQHYVRLPAPLVYYRIVADKPVYVWHIGGFGCEQGGAIIPPTNINTGSDRVAFARTSSEPFYLILITKKGSEDSFLFNGISNNLILSSDFTPVINSAWSATRLGPFTTAEIPVGYHFIENSKDIFHLGIINGGSSTGCFYGYFASFTDSHIDYYSLNIEVNPIASGEVSEDGEYEPYSEINLLATPNQGYEFVNWTIEGEEISKNENFIYIMPYHDVTVVANFKLITYSITFNLIDEYGHSLPNAIITFNGVEYPAGQFVFSDLEPNTYTYSVAHHCSPTVEGQVTVSDSDVFEEVVMQTLLGDANGDLLVNVTDVVVMVGYILETYPGNFCFYNADVVANSAIDIQDIVATANIILSEKFQSLAFVKSQEADIYLSSNGVSLRSDGTIAGLQLVITGLEQELQLINLLPNHQLAYNQIGDRVVILIFSTDNTPIDPGEIELISIGNGDLTAKWGDAIAVNSNADLVGIQKHTGGLTAIQSLANSINLMIYPNPASDNLNVAFANESLKPVNVSIISIHGQKIKEKQVSQKGPALLTFDITKMPAGAYLVRIEYNDQMLTRVIMVK